MRAADEHAVGRERQRSKLASLLCEYQHYATIIATTLITEFHLEDASKSFRPSKELGGFAGGEKSGPLPFSFPSPCRAPQLCCCSRVLPPQR